MTTAPQHTPSTGAIIVSAGASTRMGGIDKSLALLGGLPLIARTVAAVEGCEAVGRVVVVVAEQNVAAVEVLIATQNWKQVMVCAGGNRRQDSVAAGLRRLPPCDWVVVHDGARPLVDGELVTRGLEEAKATGAAIAAVPSKDTVKVVEPDGLVSETPDRSRLWLTQTPQVFRRDLLERAHREVTEEVTDDAGMIERLGVPVRVFMGAYRNIKVTTPEDLALAEVLLHQPKARP